MSEAAPLASGDAGGGSLDRHRRVGGRQLGADRGRASEDESQHHEDDGDDDQRVAHLRRQAGDAPCAENARHDRHDEKDQCPLQHGREPPLAA